MDGETKQNISFKRSLFQGQTPFAAEGGGGIDGEPPFNFLLVWFFVRTVYGSWISNVRFYMA